MSSQTRGRNRKLVLLGVILALLMGSSAADAKKNFLPSETVGKRLLRVSELADEEKFAEAEAVLEPLTKKKRLKKFDRASVFQAYGMMLAAQEKYAEAIDALEISLSVDYLPDGTMQALRYNLAQLHMSQEQFERAIELLNLWMEKEENPNAQSEFLLSAAYAQTGQWDQALPHARQAVSKSKKPVEQRLGLLLAVEYQNGNLLESLDILKQLASSFPKKRYMVQLAAAYSGLGEEDNALATLEIAYLEGWLEREAELIQLAQRYLYAELPWQAAQVLQAALKDESIEATADNLELLANALLSAREYKAALDPLARAAELSEDGNLYVRLGHVHLEIENWPEARRALDSALKKGELRNPGNVNLLLGISHYNENHYKSARSAFTAALKDQKSQKSARQWLEHVDRAEREKAQL